MRSNIKFLLLFACIVITVSLSAAQACTEPATETLHIQSAILRGQRTVLVQLPKQYCNSLQRFPVVYLLDADLYSGVFGGVVDFLAENDRIPPLIVVGIAHPDRNHDLTPTSASALKADGSPSPLPSSGGGPDFRRFIATELIPRIDREYRTAPFRILAGHSFGGLFTIDTLLSQPQLFRAYLAASPSVWWDHDLEVRRLISVFEHGQVPAALLFLSVADESDVSTSSFARFRAILAAHPGTALEWKSRRFDDEEHASSVLLAFYYGLRSIFASWPIARDRNFKIPVGGIAGLELDYANRSKLLGYEIPLSQQAVISLGSQQLYAGKLHDSLETFTRAAQLFPKSPDILDQLASTQVRTGDLKGARANFVAAIRLASQANDPKEIEYNQHLSALDQKEQH